ncbi:hypothetical protein K438DRAFT_1819436 [Mycena galopus ATCC 62051]|nr:hypothetical protein K438DRAFT_1819436 [Mycena galopus ATCC 62051]
MTLPIIQSTFGAVLVGALFLRLAGISNLQTVHYYRSYGRDPTHIKALVSLTMLLDNLHTAFVWNGLWWWFVRSYANQAEIDHIPWCGSVFFASNGCSVILCFIFGASNFLLSKRNWFMIAPVVTTLCRFHYHSFELLKMHARWIFTLGLAVSSSVDVLICGLLVYLFRSNKTEAGRVNHVLDKLILYGLESGSVGTIASMICWVAVPNLVFLGLYFVIAKLYANSLFITLNTRNSIFPGAESNHSRERRQIIFMEPRPRGYVSSASKPQTGLQINVETQTNIEYGSMYASK